MCGIIGYSIASASDEALHKIILKEAILKLNHRGPDDQGHWFNNQKTLGVAHSRLSIIDLSSNASQPMIDSSEKYIIAFNGEVYNFQALKKELLKIGHNFNSNSDTEVILNGFIEWGPEIFEKLQGMFAIAIIDLFSESIFLARDHSGQKPLFYNFDQVSGSLIFASEIKGLINFPSFSNEIDQLGINQLFEEGFCSGAQSIYKSTYKIEAGTYIKYNYTKKTIQQHSFWSLADKLQSSNYSFNLHVRSDDSTELVDELHSLLQESIDMQLNADVPVGLLLSGGVDSSLITAIASQMRSNLNTFTVRFSDYSEFDEASYAREIANNFGTHHIELEASQVDPHIIDELAYYYDEPIFDTSMVPTFLLSKLISNHCKVAIGGDGGDELFGGYPSYDKLLRINYFSSFLPIFLRQGISKVIQEILPIGFNGKKTIEYFGTDLTNSHPNTAEFFSQRERFKLFNSKQVQSIEVASKNLIHTTDLIKRATFNDFTHFLREDILVKVDRASMANSLEVRSPFLDHKIIEFAFTKIPSDYKVTRHDRKILLKKLAHKLLPETFDFQRKQGFTLPLKKLVMQKDWHEFYYQKIINSDPSIFNHKYALKLLKNQNELFNNAERLSALIFFMAWVEKFNPSF